MKRAILLVALCLSMIAVTTPFAKSIPAKTATIQSITVVSPQNNTIFNPASDVTNVTLEFYINVSRIALVASIGYHLNDTYKGTIPSNTTIQVGRNATYKLTVNATDILGDTYISEAVYFTVSTQYDLNGDRIVWVEDIILFAAAYGATPEDPNWNPKADIAPPYEKVNLNDLVTTISHYGEEWP